jgi:UDP-N-acetylmuramate dehydrogenase
MQNIGAYGVEIKDVFQSLKALNRNNFEIEEFNSAQCLFGYRESIFKHELKDQYIILSVTFKLDKNPILKMEYGAIKEVLSKKQVINPTIKSVSDAVIEIRQSKLPDPKKIGNAGSFFKAKYITQ